MSVCSLPNPEGNIWLLSSKGDLIQNERIRKRKKNGKKHPSSTFSSYPSHATDSEDFVRLKCQLPLLVEYFSNVNFHVWFRLFWPDRVMWSGLGSRWCSLGWMKNSEFLLVVRMCLLSSSSLCQLRNKVLFWTNGLWTHPQIPTRVGVHELTHNKQVACWRCWKDR